MKNEKPKAYSHLKIIGFILLPLSIIAAVFSFILSDFGPNPALFIPALLLLGISVPILIIGYQPEITKLSLKHTQYIQQETKELQKNIVNTSEEISHNAIRNAATAIKTGFKEYKYCKHCGQQIDEDSTFCKFCGKNQN